MPGIPASRRRAFNTRRRGTHRRLHIEAHSAMSEPPRKRRKIAPGGIDNDEQLEEHEGVNTPASALGVDTSSFTSRREGRLRNMASTGNATPIERPERPRRERRAPQHEPITRPRYSSAAAAAAAAVEGDGFKPREERGWEEFHEHLEIDTRLPVFPCGLVDGVVQPEHDEDEDSAMDSHSGNTLEPTSPRKRLGRPQRSQSAMLRGIGHLEEPKAVPIPGPNPREKLTLPRPSFKLVDPFLSYEKANGSIDYVDRSMANVGYQESDHFDRPEKGLIRLSEDTFDEELDSQSPKDGEHAPEYTIPRVEYDMDEQDQKWLEAYNAWRKTEGVEAIKPSLFEITMTKIEKEWHALEKRIPKPNPKPPQTHRPRSSSAAAVNGEPVPDGEEQDTKCAICDDGDCENTNAIVFCDGCDLAVHQECYGVPFIPEGQWLCRKCHLIGSGTPTCVFCPNTDGAFKQTNSARWAHLLCAIWIPEVSLGNTTFMEPVMDVEKVPKSRWRLTCDICKQKMGACIQCGHKACYTAFHVTCARRARWFVSMKSSHGGSANLDASMLRAYCGNHVSEEWAQTYNTYKATKMARKYYKKVMRGKIWADSHQANVPTALPPPPSTTVSTQEHVLPRITLTIGGNKKKKSVVPVKPTWKLPSGAPVIPITLFNALDNALLKFTIRKRREFAADMCKYWTLKREGKRGAALIKRLQLQMETFSSMEITRRNFVGMGAIGRARLQRRIEFAQDRIDEVDRLISLCSLLKDREAVKLEDAEMLKEVVDTAYFPIPPLLWPVLVKAEHLDIKSIFKQGLIKIRERLQRRGYASVAPIYADLGIVFAQVLGSNSSDSSNASSAVNDDLVTRKMLDADDKGKRVIAKRILKAIQPILENASIREGQLNKSTPESTLMELDQLLDKSIAATRSANGSPHKINGASVNGDQYDGQVFQSHIPPDFERVEVDQIVEHTNDIGVNTEQKAGSPKDHPTPDSTTTAHINGVEPHHGERDAGHIQEEPKLHHQQAPTPPLSTNSSHLPNRQLAQINTPDRITSLSLGGVPWYMQGFDPSGLTIYGEAWSGREAVRQGSEELSEVEDIDIEGNSVIDADTFDIAVQSSPRGNGVTRGRGGRGRGYKRGRGRGRGKGARGTA